VLLICPKMNIAMIHDAEAYLERSGPAVGTFWEEVQREAKSQVRKNVIFLAVEADVPDPIL
jgi:hypothetical protein